MERIRIDRRRTEPRVRREQARRSMAAAANAPLEYATRANGAGVDEELLARIDAVMESHRVDARRHAADEL